MPTSTQPRSRRRRWPWLLLAIVVAGSGLLRFGNALAIQLESDRPSLSLGTPANGSLRHGKRLPSRGENFRVYSDLGALLGRNAVHDEVRDTVLASYAALARDRPATRFVYGETGWPSGGRFRPHKTHQNGLAVDFFVPLRDADRVSRTLPAHVLNTFGYGIEFDAGGRWRGLEIDYAAMAAHLRALALAARANGLRIEVVIFDNSLQRALFEADGGRGLDSLLRFSRSRPWVRHDEHYHVVFSLID